MPQIKRRLFAFLCALMVFMGSQTIPGYAEGGEYYNYELPANPNPEELVPDGNMTLVTDITGDAASTKEFLTVTSKNGNYFYIIVDRSKKGENTVHFLNQVDEYDLLALLSEEEIQEHVQPTPTPTPVPTPIAVVTPTPEPSPEPDSDINPRAIVLLVLTVILIVLVILYFLKNRNKSTPAGNTDLDDYFDEDDEDEYAEFEEYDGEDPEVEV